MGCLATGLLCYQPLAGWQARVREHSDTEHSEPSTFRLSFAPSDIHTSTRLVLSLIREASLLQSLMALSLYIPPCIYNPLDGKCRTWPTQPPSPLVRVARSALSCWLVCDIFLLCCIAGFSLVFPFLLCHSLLFCLFLCCSSIFILSSFDLFSALAFRQRWVIQQTYLPACRNCVQ